MQYFYDDTDLSLYDSMNVFKEFYRHYVPVLSMSQADFILCGSNEIYYTDVLKDKVFVCNMTNTNHIHFDKVVSLQNETEFLDTIKSTAEYTFGLIISTLIEHMAYSSSRRSGQPRNSFSDYNLGIIGYGRVGRQLHNLVKPLGINVEYHDILLDTKIDDVIKHTQKNGILSINASVRQGQKPIIDEEILSHYSEPLIIVNTARPIAVDEEFIATTYHSYVSDFDINFSDHVAGFTMKDLKSTANFIYNKFRRLYEFQ